jgi:hypothetical protein
VGVDSTDGDEPSRASAEEDKFHCVHANVLNVFDTLDEVYDEWDLESVLGDDFSARSDPEFDFDLSACEWFHVDEDYAATQGESASEQPGRTPATDRTFLSIFLEKFPDWTEERAREILEAPIPRQEVEQFAGFSQFLFPDIDMSQDEGVDERMNKNPYPTDRERSDKVLQYGCGEARQLEKMVLVLTDLESKNLPEINYEQYEVQGNTMYKSKAKKVRPVPLNDGTGDGPGGKKNWLELSHQRFTPQEPTGKYKDHLLPRIAPFEKGSRLTPERLASLDVGMDLSPEERELFDEVLLHREGGIAFEWQECGKIHEDVTPPVLIKTLPHEAWQEKNFPCPKALIPTVTKMLLERLDRGVLEKCDGPYRNPWFLVAKKMAGTYRLINAAMKMNSVTLRDSNLPPSVDEFSEEFAGCHISSLIDFFSGYDQLTLDVRSRDMTAFQTPLGLLRMTTPPMGATNSVAQFVRVIMTILQDLWPTVAMPFLDDVGVKGPYTDYNGEMKLPGIRRFVYEHLMNLQLTLDRIERAGATVGPKSQFCYDGMGIVGFVVGSGGRQPAASKVAKVVKWKPCRDVTDVKAFIGLCVYYRIWIKDFGQLADPLYNLCRKGVEWDWKPEVHGAAMQRLKDKLTSAPILCRLHYDPAEKWGIIVLAVDASLEGWGGTLGQYDDKGRKRVARYESGLWNTAERNYDATKRECRGVLKCLYKLRFWLYGVHFILETDANVLVAQLNRAATDLPGSLVTRWLAWIRLFDFKVKHIKGTKHTAADALSRRPPASDDTTEDEEDIDELVAAELDSLEITLPSKIHQSWYPDARTTRSDLNSWSISQQAYDIAILSTTVNNSDESVFEMDDEGADLSVKPLNDSYTEAHQDVAWYLTTLARPPWLSRAEFLEVIQKSKDYSVRDRQLWRNAEKAHPPRLVIDAQEQKDEIIQYLHDKTGHGGRENTYRRVASRYFWTGCYMDVKKYVDNCLVCRKKEKRRQEEALYPQQAVPLFHRINVDITYLPKCGPYNCLCVARDDFSGWPEVKPMTKPNSKNVAEFLWEIICRHGVFGQVSVDGGTEFKKAVIRELARLSVKRVVISAHNSKAAGAVEVGHKAFIMALIALTEGGKKPWLRYLSTVTLAERTTTHAPTGRTPFYMVYGREAVLPIETTYSTWRTLKWGEVTDRTDLLTLRARMVEMRDEDMQEAMLQKDRFRRQNQAYFDSHHRLRRDLINEGDIVLVYDIITIDVDKSNSTKLNYRWLGPYRVTAADQQKGSYSLAELDGTPMSRTYAGNKLKKFTSDDGYYRSLEDREDTVEELPAIPFRPETSLAEEFGFEREPRTRNQIQQAVEVEVQVPGLSQAEKNEYLRFQADWGDIEDNVEDEEEDLTST